MDCTCSSIQSNVEFTHPLDRARSTIRSRPIHQKHHFVYVVYRAKYRYAVNLPKYRDYGSFDPTLYHTPFARASYNTVCVLLITIILLLQLQYGLETGLT